MEEDELAWPDEKKSIFSLANSGPASPTWCSIGWRPEGDDGSLAAEFKDAADGIIDQLRAGTLARKPDGQFVPIAYLYRHSLELSLKHLIRLALNAELVAESAQLQKALTRHDLDRLWSYARRAIETRWPNGERLVIDNTESLINDFHTIDESGQNLRYTNDSSGRAAARNYPSAIELLEFRRAVQEVHNLLLGCAMEFQSILDGPSFE